ncbi:hypothetical protein ACB098_08G173500 [Castanea mollissima]
MLLFDSAFLPFLISLLYFSLGTLPSQKALKKRGSMQKVQNPLNIKTMCFQNFSLASP